MTLARPTNTIKSQKLAQIHSFLSDLNAACLSSKRSSCDFILVQGVFSLYMLSNTKIQLIVAD